MSEWAFVVVLVAAAIGLVGGLILLDALASDDPEGAWPEDAWLEGERPADDEGLL